MTSQRFPVLDRLLRKRHIMDMDSEIDAAWGSVKVDASAASEMYWQTPKEHWGDGDFPPVRLPFPSMWMEWEQPTKWITDGGREIHSSASMQTELGTHYAVLVQEVHGDSIDTPGVDGGTVALPKALREGCISIKSFALREGMATCYAHVGLVKADDRGKPDLNIRWAGPNGPGSDTTINLLDTHFVNVAMLAVGLMNCKNVDLVEHESKVPVGRRQRRRNGGIRYRTIDIPGRSTGTSSGAGGTSASGLHRVRGHFKTFTEDAPLMGMHIGTYWWGWQVRGSKSNGTVVSDYRMTERVEATS